MLRLASCLCAALLALSVASCSKDVPTSRFECTCHAMNVASDNSRFYPLCESDGSQVAGDAVDMCETDFGAEAGCECTCDRVGDC